MKPLKFSCHACGQAAVSAHRGTASCGHCGQRYEQNMKEIAKIAAFAPLLFLVAALCGAWWLMLAGIPVGLYVAHGFDRLGKGWRPIPPVRQGP